jgi:hypothetical protein
MATVMDRKTSFAAILVHCYHSFATIICMFTYARGNPNVVCREREREKEALLTFKQGIIDRSNQLSFWIGQAPLVQSMWWTPHHVIEYE